VHRTYRANGLLLDPAVGLKGYWTIGLTDYYSDPAIRLLYYRANGLLSDPAIGLMGYWAVGLSG